MNPHRPYVLQEYDPNWNVRFLDASERLRPLFGDNLFEIDHIGSTSIKGMLAKPQVDVLVVVKDLEAVRSLYETFLLEGYTVHGRGYVAPDDEYISRDDASGARLLSIHVLQAGNPKINEYKVFRDYLSSHVKDRELYVAAKKELYVSHSGNYAEYVRGKQDVIDTIKARAMTWAKTQS